MSWDSDHFPVVIWSFPFICMVSLSLSFFLSPSPQFWPSVCLLLPHRLQPLHHGWSDDVEGILLQIVQIQSAQIDWTVNMLPILRSHDFSLCIDTQIIFLRGGRSYISHDILTLNGSQECFVVLPVPGSNSIYHSNVYVWGHPSCNAALIEKVTAFWRFYDVG